MLLDLQPGTVLAPGEEYPQILVPDADSKPSKIPVFFFLLICLLGEKKKSLNHSRNVKVGSDLFVECHHCPLAVNVNARSQKTLAWNPSLTLAVSKGLP